MDKCQVWREARLYWNTPEQHLTHPHSRLVCGGNRTESRAKNSSVQSVKGLQRKERKLVSRAAAAGYEVNESETGRNLPLGTFVTVKILA